MTKSNLKNSRKQSSCYARFASPKDEHIIRDLLNITPLAGKMNVQFRREPNANIAADVEGLKHHTVLVYSSTGNKLVGMGSRSVREIYYNGEVCRIGYLSLLRGKPGWKGLQHWVKGFQEIGGTHLKNELPFDMSCIVSDNKISKRILERGLKGFPNFQHYADLTTFIISTKSKSRNITSNVCPATAKDTQSLSRCLHNYLSQYQLAPYWNMNRLLERNNNNNLTIDDFLLIRDGGQVSSCLAIWDQRKYKQVVIKGYSKYVSYLRPFLNILLLIMGKPMLPKPPGELELAYLSHLAVKDNNPDTFRSLLDAARSVAAHKGFKYLVLGLTTKHPLYRVMSQYGHHVKYASDIYTVSWHKNVHNIHSDTDTRIPHIDVAIL